MPAPLLVLGAATSVQFGAGIAKLLFDEAGPLGTVTMRVAFAALILLAIWRPRNAGRAPRDWRLIAAYGLVLVGMNAAFYLALERIPLGIAVTLEFVGPLAVAVLGSRRGLDLVWAALAAAGILALADPGGGTDAVGVALALGAGVCWGVYILIAARVGERSEGGSELALAMAIGALALLPFGIADGGEALLDPLVLAAGVGVAVLSSAIPYSLELEALRKLPQHVFGVLMSLEPALAALAGLVVLGEVLDARELTGVALVVVASAGAARSASAPVRDV